MSPELPRARVVVPRSRAGTAAVARAALEMTASCYAWLERGEEGMVVDLEAVAEGELDLEGRFERELSRVLSVAALERRTVDLRTAVLARALGPRPEPPPVPVGPTLAPETEAEIERLLAEIESDDWLGDGGEIAKTWEDRFGPGEGEDR